jgi:hypothetical protein
MNPKVVRALPNRGIAPMVAEHLARITWSGAQAERGLPQTPRLVDPAWFADAAPTQAEGWSLECCFDVPPREQGNPSLARIRFLVDEAPEDRLRAGAVLYLFERGTGGYATVEILP